MKEGTTMMNKDDLDAEALRKLERIADIEGVTLEEVLDAIEEAKKKFYNSLS